MVTKKRNSKNNKNYKLKYDLTKLVKTLIGGVNTQNSKERAASKLQSLVRGKQTRKKIKSEKQKNQKKLEKYKELIGPKFNKTLLELPLPILKKLINQIVSQLNIEDVEVSNHLINYFLSIKTNDQIKYIIDKIIFNQKKIIKLIKDYLENLRNVLNYTTYPSDADEDEVERIQFDFASDIDIAQRNMRDIEYEVNILRKKNNIFMNKFIELLDLLDISMKDSEIQPFINYCIDDKDWPDEFLAAETFYIIVGEAPKKFINDIESYFNNKDLSTFLTTFILNKLYQKLVITRDTSYIFQEIDTIYNFFKK